MGWCGYLSLEWAERRARGVGGDGLDLRLAAHRDRLASVLTNFLHRCLDAGVREKLQRALAHLGGTSGPESLGRESGLWLDTSDIQHMELGFPVVVWGLDNGDGLRRVMYPPLGNGPMCPDWVEEVMRTPAQVVLDSAHFFPLDEVPEGPPASMDRLRVELMDKGAAKASGSVVRAVVVRRSGTAAQRSTPGGPSDVEVSVGMKRGTGSIEDWVVRKAKSPREWRVRKDLEIDGLAGMVRRSLGAGSEARRQRWRDKGSWAPGAGAEPPD